MKNLKIKQNAKAKDKFDSYPQPVREKLLHLRNLIIQTATDNDSISEIEETLKWGEPSYLVKKGSTIRMDWKSKTPDQYQLYFKCTSKLVITFRELYGDDFNYENNRAIIFKMEEEVPDKKLMECIEMALCYHEIKHLPLLGKIAL